MKYKIILLLSFVFIMSGCDEAKKNAAEAYHKAQEQAYQAYETTKQKLNEVTEDAVNEIKHVSDSAARKLNDVNTKISDYSQQQVDKITESIRLWIFESIKPALPWAFLISFLLTFAALKVLIPFSNYPPIQITALIFSYGFIFSVFYRLDITSYALEATLWFVSPIVIVSFVLFLLKEKILPKVQEWNKKMYALDNKDGDIDVDAEK